MSESDSSPSSASGGDKISPPLSTSDVLSRQMALGAPRQVGQFARLGRFELLRLIGSGKMGNGIDRGAGEE